MIFFTTWQFSCSRPRGEHLSYLKSFTEARLGLCCKGLTWLDQLNQENLLLMNIKTPGGSSGKESIYNTGGPDSVLGLGRSPGEGNSNPLQYSCLRNSMDKGAWWTIVHWVSKSQTWLITNTFTLKDNWIRDLNYIPEIPSLFPLQHKSWQ